MSFSMDPLAMIVSLDAVKREITSARPDSPVAPQHDRGHRDLWRLHQRLRRNGIQRLRRNGIQRLRRNLAAALAASARKVEPSEPREPGCTVAPSH